MTEQEWSHDYTEKGFRDLAQYFYCTIVNQTYIAPRKGHLR